MPRACPNCGETNVAPRMGGCNRCVMYKSDVEYLFREHRNAVRAVLLQYESNFHTIDELTQETYLRALEAVDSFRGDSKPLTWICGIAKNVARGYIRKCIHSPPVLHENELTPVQAEEDDEIAAYYDAAEAFDPSDDPAPKLEAEDAVEDATRRLPSLIADTVLLKMDGKTTKEIASIIGISPTYVTTLLSRGKKIYTSL